MTLSQLIDDILNIELQSSLIDQSLNDFFINRVGLTSKEVIDKVSKIAHEAKLEYLEIVRKDMRDQFSPDRILEFHKMVTSDLYSSYTDFWKLRAVIYANILSSKIEKLIGEDYI